MLDHLKQVAHYRELVRNLTLRDLKVRYRNSIFGFLWAWGNPILMTIVFTTVFKILLNSPVNHFPLFIMIGWLVWTFTISSVTDGINSVVGNSNLVKKVWFPREVLPASAVLANAANFLLALPLVLALIVFYGIQLEPAVLVYFPIIFASQVALVLGIAFFLSGANVYYRDTAVITAVLVTAWFFLTPVIYPVKFLTGTWNGIDLGRVLYIVNPMASIIESYRNILYGSIEGVLPASPDMGFLLRTLATTLVILLLGYLFFNRVSHRFGEEL